MGRALVPNITMGPNVVKAIRPYTQKPLDVHLMIAPAEPYLAAFADAGADRITIHVEAERDVAKSLATIRARGQEGRHNAEARHGRFGDRAVSRSGRSGAGDERRAGASAVRRSCRPPCPASPEIRTLLGDRIVPIEVDGGITPDNADAVAKGGRDGTGRRILGLSR